MAVQPIRLFGDPVLRTPAAPVVDFDVELRTLVRDLTDTMLEAPGAGLAAPQLGVGLRVFTWYVDGELGHLVNPELTLSEEQQEGEEGCLSIPDLAFECRRARQVVARGFDMHGEPVRIEGSDLLARAIQHETDHLDGVLFVQRLDAETRRLAMRAIRESEWFGSGATSWSPRGGAASSDGEAAEESATRAILTPSITPTIKVSPHPMRGLAV